MVVAVFGQGPSQKDVVVSPKLIIPAAELVWRFSPSGGPGGQHANTANTRAVLTWEFSQSVALGEQQRALLTDRFGSRIQISVDDTRSQSRNRSIATDRLVDMVKRGLHTERPRKPAKPSRSSQRRRVESKRKRSQVKANRRRPSIGD